MQFVSQLDRLLARSLDHSTTRSLWVSHLVNFHPGNVERDPLTVFFGGKPMEALVSPINVSWAAWIWHFLYMFTFSLHFHYIFFTFSLHVLYIFQKFVLHFFTFSLHFRHNWGAWRPPKPPCLTGGLRPPDSPTLITLNMSPKSLQLMPEWCPNDVQMMSKWCLNDAQMMSKWCPNDVQLMSKWCPDDVQMMPRWCPNLVQNSTCTMAIVHVLWP